MRVRHRVTLAAAAGAVGALLAVGVAVAPAAGASSCTSSFVGGFKTITTVASTVPKNGDVNPYGVAVVTRSKDRLHRGDVLVSNFNDKANTQGTGTTIVEVAPNHSVRVFAQINAAHLPGACPGGVGLTTALADPRQRLGDRRQPAHHRREPGHRQGRAACWCSTATVAWWRRSTATASTDRGT